MKKIKPLDSFDKKIQIPGDKSISHRAIILSSIAKGNSEIKNFVTSKDCMNTIECLRQSGVRIELDKNHIYVAGKGMKGLIPAKTTLYVGNSGTTIRLLSGLLSAQKFDSIIAGDESISKRPMDRIIHPLRLMGAKIWGQRDKYPPLKIKGSNLKGIDYISPVASAQVKSCILLAGLYANGTTVISEPFKSRDHTERMLEYLGADISVSENSVIIKGGNQLISRDINIPGDISSASFFIVAALTSKNSSLLIENVGINPTRTGIIDVLLNMGANIRILNKRIYNNEPVGDILVKSSHLKAVTIQKQTIPRVIDEIPILAVAASCAQGTTVIKDAQELKLKESDRINTISSELNKIGAKIQPKDDGMIIQGCRDFVASAQIDTHNDHRIAMAASIAGLNCKDGLTINNAECVDISFPGFFQLLEQLRL
ncbi:MAG: 3-phosphoshikimate 1-carboxyvinyltransferase [Clostridia bacterium]|nr:3-phosphoshikimate 1-carboxyvinyltransferase [Clostridia bacterium]